MRVTIVSASSLDIAGHSPGAPRFPMRQDFEQSAWAARISDINPGVLSMEAFLAPRRGHSLQRPARWGSGALCWVKQPVVNR
jgi:hypothetical protein